MAEKTAESFDWLSMEEEASQNRRTRSPAKDLPLDYLDELIEAISEKDVSKALSILKENPKALTARALDLDVENNKEKDQKKSTDVLLPHPSLVALDNFHAPMMDMLVKYGLFNKRAVGYRLARHVAETDNADAFEWLLKQSKFIKTISTKYQLKDFEENMLAIEQLFNSSVLIPNKTYDAGWGVKNIVSGVLENYAFNCMSRMKGLGHVGLCDSYNNNNIMFHPLVHAASERLDKLKPFLLTLVDVGADLSVLSSPSASNYTNKWIPLLTPQGLHELQEIFKAHPKTKILMPKTSLPYFRPKALEPRLGFHIDETEAACAAPFPINTLSEMVVRHGSPVVQKMVQSEKGLEIVEKILLSRPFSLLSFVYAANADTQIAVLRKSKNLQDFRDEKGNTMAHYILASRFCEYGRRALVPKKTQDALVSINANLLLEKNNQGIACVHLEPELSNPASRRLMKKELLVEKKLPKAKKKLM